MNLFRNTFLPGHYFENIFQWQPSIKMKTFFFFFLIYSIVLSSLFLKAVIFVSVLYHCLFTFVLSLCLFLSMVTQKLLTMYTTYQQKDSEGRSIKYKKCRKVCLKLHGSSLTSAGFNLIFSALFASGSFSNIAGSN